MADKRPALGRGLSALIPDATANVTPQPRESSAEVDLDLLGPNPFQPRLNFDEERLDELAASIRSNGIIQPILVRKRDRRYEIIAGERRWRAAQMAGLHEIPAVIRRVPDEAAVAMSLIENIQRENLNPLEEARALDRLIREFDMTHQTAADAVGRSRAAVSNLLRLLELADDVKKLVEERQLEMGHARALLGLNAGRQQSEVATLVARKGLSVRETEALVRRMTAQKGETADPEPERRDPNVDRLERSLAEKLGAKVHLQHSTKGRGKLVISYNSLDELDGILEHIQ